MSLLDEVFFCRPHYVSVHPSVRLCRTNSKLKN